MDYRHGAHTVFMVHLHLVWVTKYRKPVLTGEVGLRVRELIRQICREQEVEILKGHVARDHVHLVVSSPAKVTTSRLVQRLKREDSHHLLAECRPSAAGVLGPSPFSGNAASHDCLAFVCSHHRQSV